MLNRSLLCDCCFLLDVQTLAFHFTVRRHSHLVWRDSGGTLRSCPLLMSPPASDVVGGCCSPSLFDSSAFFPGCRCRPPPPRAGRAPCPRFPPGPSHATLSNFVIFPMIQDEEPNVGHRWESLLGSARRRAAPGAGDLLYAEYTDRGPSSFDAPPRPPPSGSGPPPNPPQKRSSRANTF